MIDTRGASRFARRVSFLFLSRDTPIRGAEVLSSDITANIQLGEKRRREAARGRRWPGSPSHSS